MQTITVYDKNELNIVIYSSSNYQVYSDILIIAFKARACMLLYN